jgi:hypothetical protein
LLIPHLTFGCSTHPLVESHYRVNCTLVEKIQIQPGLSVFRGQFLRNKAWRADR